MAWLMGVETFALKHESSRMNLHILNDSGVQTGADELIHRSLAIGFIEFQHQSVEFQFAFCRNIDPGKSILKKKPVHYKTAGAFIHIMVELISSHYQKIMDCPVIYITIFNGT